MSHEAPRRIDYFNARRARANSGVSYGDVILGSIMLLLGIFFLAITALLIFLALSWAPAFGFGFVFAIMGSSMVYVGFEMVRRRTTRPPREVVES